MWRRQLPVLAGVLIRIIRSILLTRTLWVVIPAVMRADALFVPNLVRACACVDRAPLLRSDLIVIFRVVSWAVR